jgi:predicted metal-dependent phosphotriesterase family hydrolase
MARMDPDALAALYVRDCTVGIEGTSIKAGIIKCAHQTGVTWQKGEGFTRTGEVPV